LAYANFKRVIPLTERAVKGLGSGLTASQVKHPALTIHMTASLREAADLMIQHHHHRVVVIDPAQPDSMPLGIISSYDIVAEMARPESVWQRSH
jgi:CBS domain-containing protein